MKNSAAFLTKGLFVAILSTFLSLTPTASLLAQSSDVSAETRNEIMKLNDQLENLIQKKDFASIVDLYADDATIINSGGKKITGRKAIAEFWYSLGNTKSMTSDVIEVGGDNKIVYQVGKWTMTQVKDGVEKTITSDILLVWKRDPSYGYKIQLNSSNNPVAAVSSKVQPYEANQIK